MRLRWFYSFGMLLGMVALGAISAEATTASGSLYALPSWDQTLSCSTPSKCPRFIVLSNWNKEAVLDEETGLVWEKAPSTKSLSWYDAQSYCATLTIGNHLGWRLPAVQELSSLMDTSVLSPGLPLPSGHPFMNVKSDFYFSANTRGDDTTFAWDANFNDGTVGYASKALSYYVWCVRGGHVDLH